jgi:hypothetical protein
MIPTPYILIGAVIAALALYFTGHHNGWAERDAEMQIAIAKKDAEAREIEHVMTGKINDHATKLLEANDAITEKQSALDRAIRSGKLRLTQSCVQASPSTASVSGTSAATGSESDRQIDQTADADRATLEAIAAIVADGDKAINQLNACINSYNTVREQINAQQ